jgi:hypothetical protein
MYHNMAHRLPENVTLDKNVVEGIIKALNKKFGKESALTMTSGKILEYRYDTGLFNKRQG